MRYRDLFEAVEPSKEALIGEILTLWRAQPSKWREADGSETWKNQFLDRGLANDSIETLNLTLAALRKDAAYLAANPKAKIKTAFDGPQFTRKQKKTLATLLERAKTAFVAHLRTEHEPDALADLLKDKNALLSEFEIYLDDSYSVTVRPDGLVHFWRMEPGLDAWIGDLPVALYHFTASGVLRSIKASGLEADRVSVNRTTMPGVYLTTESSGNAIDGYVRNAVRTHGGRAIRITVLAYLSELQADEDDADIQSGAHQYVMPHVPPERIVSVENA